MGNLWLKIKIWSKIIVVGLLVLFALIFVLKNHGEPVKIWVWNSIDTTVLRLLFFTVIFSVALTLLTGTAFRTLRQVRELRERNRQAKLHKDMADMQAKAAMLQTKSSPGDAKPIQ